MSQLSIFSAQSIARGEIPEFIIPSLKTESKARLSNSSSAGSLLSSCSSGTLHFDGSPLPSRWKNSPTPRSRPSPAAYTPAFLKEGTGQHGVRRFSEQVWPIHSGLRSLRPRELFPLRSSPALLAKRKSRPSPDTSKHALDVARAFELQSGRTCTTDVAPAFGGSISVSATYNARNKGLQFSIHGLYCDVPTVGYNQDSYLVKLTLTPVKRRHLLRDIPSSHDSDGSILPPTRAVFKGVKSTSLSSKTLTINVYARALLRRTGRLLYQASIPLVDVSLTGDANWVALKPAARQKAASSISFCMCYTARKKKLMITVVNAKSLKMSALRKDSYVEVKLFRRDGAENEAMKTVRTKCHRGGSNPVYKEAFSFDFTTEGSDASRYAELTFTVRRKGFLGADMVLGEVTLSSDLQLRWKKSESLKNTLDEVFRYTGKVITQSHNLSTSS